MYTSPLSLIYSVTEQSHALLAMQEVFPKNVNLPWERVRTSGQFNNRLSFGDYELKTSDSKNVYWPTDLQSPRRVRLKKARRMPKRVLLQDNQPDSDDFVRTSRLTASTLDLQGWQVL
jgi:hypothetical protein